MIKILLLAVVPFITQHRNVVPKTEVSTNFYGSVTGIVDKAYIEARVGVGGGGGCDTNAVDILANSAVVTNALTVATTNRVALLESSKADNSALAAHTANTDNPHAVTAAQVGAVGIGERIEFTQDMGEGLTAEAWFDPFLLALDHPNFGTAYHRGGYSTYYSTYNSIYGFIQIGIPEGISNYDGPGVFISFESTTKYLHHTIEQWNQDGSLYTLMYFPEGQQGTIALRDLSRIWRR